MRSELHKVRKDFSHFQARVTFEVTRDRVYESDGEFILEPNKYNIYRIWISSGRTTLIVGP